MKTSQVWSMDIMIAIVVFIGAIFAFYSIISNKYSSKTDELHDDASIVMENLNITGNITQVEELLKESYPDLKRKLRIKNEFCIFFEDENGNIIYISRDQAGIGSEKIKVSNVSCG